MGTHPNIYPPDRGGTSESPNNSILFDGFTTGDCELDGILTPCSMALRSPEGVELIVGRRLKSGGGWEYLTASADWGFRGNGSLRFFIPGQERDIPDSTDPNNIVINTVETPGFWFSFEWGSSTSTRGEQLPKCLRDFLRPFFQNVQLGNFKTISPVDDARFIAISGLGHIAGAMTAGLYDIYYDPKLVDLTGGADKSSIGTIVEEIAHTLQFIAVWEKIESQTSTSGSYNRAMDAWRVNYFSNSAGIVLQNLAKATDLWLRGVTEPLEDPYFDNAYEKEAQEKRAQVVQDTEGQKNPCY